MSFFQSSSKHSFRESSGKPNLWSLWNCFPRLSGNVFQTYYRISFWSSIGNSRKLFWFPTKFLAEILPVVKPQISFNDLSEKSSYVFPGVSSKLVLRIFEDSMAFSVLPSKVPPAIPSEVPLGIKKPKFRVCLETHLKLSPGILFSGVLSGSFKELLWEFLTNYYG